jgi:hypothetical protein
MKSGEDRAAAAQRDDAIDWSHDFQEGGVIKCRFGRRGRWLIAEWPELARLTCDETGSQMELVPCDGAPPRTLAKLRGVVTVLVGDLRGGLGVHASAVALGRRAVILLGEANAGKSTAAAELCLRHRGRLLADDVSLLEDRRSLVHVVPSEQRHYLTPEAGRVLGVRVSRSRLGPKGKAAVVPTRLARRSYPLSLAVVLRFDDSLSGAVRTPLRGAQAVLRVLSSLYRFDLRDRRDELERVSHVYAQAPVVEIARPRRSPSVAAEVLRALEDGHGG